MTTDPATSADPQAGDTDPQPQAGVPSTDPQAGESQNNDTISLDEAKKLRSEAANLRKRLKAFEDAENKAKEAQLSEQQKLEKKLADLQSQYDDATRQAQERTINLEVRLQAATMGIKYPDKAAKLLDWAEIQHDDEGKPTNVKELLDKLVKEMPELLGKAQVQTSGGATNPPRSQSTAPQALSWEVIGNMKPDEYNARRAEIQQWIATHPHRFGQRI